MTEVPPAAPQYTSGANPASYPGKGLGIAGLILAIFLNVIGLIISIVARVQSSRAGFKNGPALAGIIIGIITTLGSIAIAVAVGAGIASLASHCADLGPGTHQVGGVTYTCG